MRQKNRSEITALSTEIVQLIDSEANGDFYALRVQSSVLFQKALEISTRISDAATSLINQDSDPFCSEYAQQQEALHNLITGRETHVTSETTPGEDLSEALWHANPYGWDNHSFIAKYQYLTACITRMVGRAPRNTPLKVLDMGCGRGLTSEILAQTGADITGFDIDPKWARFSEGRAKIRGFNISRIIGGFDTISSCISSLEEYDAILFCASLHHCKKPWQMINTLTNHLKPGGIITFFEEPVNQIWWKHWGLRLDPESIYVMAKFGWFESGWSLAFLEAMADRLGLVFKLFNNQNHDQIGIFTRSKEDMRIPSQNIIRLGFEAESKPKFSTPRIVSNFAGRLYSDEERRSACPNSFIHWTVEIENGSDETWECNSENPINLSYHWCDPDGRYIVYDGERTPLHRNQIKPNQRISCIANIKTPQAPGNYLLMITLVQEEVAWFEERSFVPLQHIISIT